MIGRVIRCSIEHVTLWNEQSSLDIPANQVHMAEGSGAQTVC